MLLSSQGRILSIRENIDSRWNREKEDVGGQPFKRTCHYASCSMLKYQESAFIKSSGGLFSSALQAHQGDCIWVRCVSEKTVNIVIDAGTSTFKREFKNLVEEINNKKEKIDLLVFTHIDDDHIKGCIQYLQEKGKNY